MLFCFYTFALAVSTFFSESNAFPTGAGGCASGQSAAMAGHGPVTSSLEAAGFQLAVENTSTGTIALVTPGNEPEMEINQEYVIQVRGGGFTGFLFRAESVNTGLSVSSTSSSGQVASVCDASNEVGITHNDNSMKTDESILVEATRAGVNSAMLLDVTLVQSNPPNVHYYSGFRFPLVESSDFTPAPVDPITPSPTEPNTPSPVDSTTPTPTEPNTPAPVISSTPMPAMDPQTPAPVDPTTPSPIEATTPAPVISLTSMPSMEPQTSAPVDPTTQIPVEATTQAPVDSMTPMPVMQQTPAPVESTTVPPTETPVDTPASPGMCQGGTAAVACSSVFGQQSCSGCVTGECSGVFNTCVASACGSISGCSCSLTSTLCINNNSMNTISCVGTGTVDCSEFASSGTCVAAGCEWVPTADGGSSTTNRLGSPQSHAFGCGHPLVGALITLWMAMM